MANTGNRITYSVGFNIDRRGIAEVQAALRALQTSTSPNMTNELRQASQAAGTLNSALRAAFNQDIGKIDLGRFNTYLRQSGTDLNTLRTQLANAGVEGQRALSKLNNELKLSGQHLTTLGPAAKSVVETLMNSTRWFLASSAINRFADNAAAAVSYVKQLNSSLRDIQVVSGYTNEYMKEFAQNANEAAKAIGLTTLDYTEAALIYIQQGKRDEIVNQLSDITLRAAQVVGTSTKDMSEYLTAVWNGFQIGAADAELAVDKLAAVGANSGANLQELATGMSKVAAVAKVLGMDLDQLNAIMATIQTVTRQAPESIGTALVA